jgi:hypothetical protein
VVSGKAGYFQDSLIYETIYYIDFFKGGLFSIFTFFSMPVVLEKGGGEGISVSGLVYCTVAIVAFWRCRARLHALEKGWGYGDSSRNLYNLPLCVPADGSWRLGGGGGITTTTFPFQCSFDMGVNTQVPKTAEEYDVSIHELPTFLFIEAKVLVNQNPNFSTFFKRNRWTDSM